MATSKVVCNVCSLDQTTKSSAVWCSKCNQCLCIDCKERHSLAKATQDHDTIIIDENQTLPPFIVEDVVDNVKNSRKTKSLTDIVVRAVTPPADIGQCNKCELSTCITCKNIQCTNTFKSTHTKESFLIYCTATCQTSNVIYLLECGVCAHQYVGQTSRQLTTRVEEHGFDVVCKPNNSFSRHFKSTDHQDSFKNIKVTIIEHDPDWDCKRRKERESFWIRKLKTLFPNGINKKE